VKPYTVVLTAPRSVKVGRTFLVTWRGPNGPADYVTIVAVGAAPGAYGSYAYTRDGSPATLTAPTTAGDYEIRYQSDRVQNVVFGSITIKITK
jgi:Ca-activated chloride channel family protein